MKKLLLIAVIAVGGSCKETVPLDYYDKLLDFVIANRSENFIELPDLYDETEQPRADFSTDKLLLSDKLKARGFKLVNSKQSNSPLAGQQTVTQTLVGENCECEVVKTYTATPVISRYSVSEKIKCR